MLGRQVLLHLQAIAIAQGPVIDQHFRDVAREAPACLLWPRPVGVPPAAQYQFLPGDLSAGAWARSLLQAIHPHGGVFVRDQRGKSSCLPQRPGPGQQVPLPAHPFSFNIQRFEFFLELAAQIEVEPRLIIASVAGPDSEQARETTQALVRHRHREQCQLLGCPRALGRASQQVVLTIQPDQPTVRLSQQLRLLLR